MLLWRLNDNRLYMRDSDTLRVLDVSDTASIIGAARGDVSGSVEFVDGDSRTIAVLELDRTIRTLATLPRTATTFTYAVKADGVWFLAGRDIGGYVSVFRVDRGGLARIYSLAASQRSEAPVYLRPARGGILMARAVDPYDVYHISDAGVVIRQLVPAPPAGVGDWLALPALQVDGAYLQVLADRQSDRRELILWDSTGKAMNRRRIDAPIGFLDADPATRQVIASRDGVGGREIVVYHYNWVEAATSSKEELP